jgi:DNA-binding response OmpR family regulator
MTKNILHADDDQLVRALLDEALHFMGYRVTGVGDPEAALAKFREETFSVVITDHRMPLGGGLRLVEGLRAEGFEGRVFVLSGALSEEERRAYALLGIDGVLIKPFDLWSLHQMLKQETHPRVG